MTSTAATELVTVRQLAHTDVRFAARLHARALPHGFFARLGSGFLRAYYEAFRASPSAVALIADVDGRPAGMLVGTLSTRAHYRWVLRHRGWALAAAGALALLRRPRELAFFLSTRAGWYVRGLRELRARRPAEDASPVCRTAVLAHVAVDSSLRGAGTGARLVEAFADAARTAGCERAYLVTLAGEQGAGPFYDRLGWSHAGDLRDRDGRLLSSYTRLL